MANLVIPEGISKIEESPFYDCTSSTGIKLSDTSDTYDSKEKSPTVTVKYKENYASTAKITMKAAWKRNTVGNGY